jgi:transcriptional regulator with XRE-family HTH domain
MMGGDTSMEGDAVKRWREAHGLTQEALADLLGVRAISVSRWERGAQRPPGYLLDLALETLDRRLKEEQPS